METMEKTIIEEIIASEEHEFVEGDSLEVSANYVVLCEEKSFEGYTSRIYEQKICGETLADWVGKACPEKPIFLTLSDRENFLDLIKPYARQNEYTVVLFASTPLITKSKIKDLLGFAYRKRLNVCRLKKGYILKNEYISNIDEIYATLAYTLESNDFNEVKTVEDLSIAKETLTKRMFNFHKKNGVVFENEKLTNLNSNVYIGAGSEIGAGVSLLSGSFFGENVVIQEGAIISNSKIGDDSIIETGAVIKNSLIKAGSIIETRSVVNHSVVGERARVCLCAKLTNSALKNNAILGENSYSDNANVLENAVIGKNSYVIGTNRPVIIKQNDVISPCSRILGEKK